jgi:hypothetical protein
VVLVHGIIFSHYSIDDRSAEASAMVQLFESGYADQNDKTRRETSVISDGVAVAMGCSG